MNFIKMHGLSNDFIILDLRDGSPLPDKDVLIAMMDRKTGVGCDQLIPILPPDNADADAYMLILNAPTASEAQACGNATRCVADILMNDLKKDRVTIQTVAGLLPCWREDDGRITADMGVPKLHWQDIPLSQERDTLNLEIGTGAAQNPVGVNIGNPHAVFFVDDAENFPVQELGPGFETNDLFPEKANIEFATVLDRQNIRMRVWERDTGETEACGSAACATAVAAVRRGHCDRKLRVIVNGGNLDFHWREDDDHILMTGPVAYVFEGRLLD